MGPGPSEVHPRVLEALSRPTIGHLDPAFIGMMDEIKANLRTVFATDNEMTMPISGPGSAAQEACVVNLLEPGDTFVVCINGAFGGRLAEMGRRARANVVTVEQEWGRAVDPEALRAELQRAGDVKLVGFVHAETSTGALSDGKAVAAVAREHGALVLMDTVTSLGGVPVKVDEWGVDACYSGTQKCLSCPPGLGPMTLSDRALKVVKERSTPVQSWFLDFSLLTSYWGGGAQRSYHHTAPINSLYGLHEALLVVLEEGLEATWARHKAAHDALVAGLATMGLGLLVPEAERIPELSTVLVPEGIDEGAVRKALLDDYGIEISAGLGPLAGKVWRIGLMGHSAFPENVATLLNAMETILGGMGLDIGKGEAAKAAAAVGA